MNWSVRLPGIGLASVLLVAGCAVPKKGGFDEVTVMVGARAAHRVHWSQGGPEDREIEAAVEGLLAQPLDADGAVQVALLNNRRLQALYEELGVAQADLVQAGLLRNPVLFGSSRSSNRSSSGNNTEFGIAQDFLDILVRPARRKLASAEFEGTKLRVAHAVLDHAADTEVAYSTLQGSMHATAMLRAITDAAEAAYEFARRQRQAGNLTELDLLAHQGLYEQARIELTRSEATVLEDRERLTSLMGLWGTDTQWRIPERLPDLPMVEVDLAHLESLAISRRLDLAAERWRIASIAKALSITLHWRYVPLINVGVDTERDTDGERVTGPSLAIELPIFDHGQARVARAEALLREGQQRMTALAIEIRSDVRAARNKLVFSRELVEHYREVVIPVRERSVAESQRYYNYMLLGVYQLLQATRDELDAYGDYIDSLRDYWVARAELKRAVGGSFAPDARASPAPLTREPDSQDDDASHHDH